MQDNIENFDKLKEEWADDEEEDSEGRAEEKDFYTPEKIKEIKEEKELLDQVL